MCSLRAHCLPVHSDAILNVLRRWAVLFLSASVIFGAAYNVVPIPTPSGYHIINIGGINDAGQVTGMAVTPAFTQQAFVGSPASSSAVPLPSGWASSSANGINNSGQITGAAYIGASAYPTAFFGTSSGISAIPLPSGYNWSMATGINASGQVSGFVAIATVSSVSGQRAFQGTASGITLLPLLPGWPGSDAGGINGFGQITGSNGGSGTAPYVGTPSGVTALPVPVGWIYASGIAINDSGVVVLSGDNPLNAQTYLYTASRITVIPLPAGAVWANPGGSNAINNAGAVVGVSGVGGWIWTSGQGLIMLDSQVPAGWTVQAAFAINTSGVIAAQGKFNGGAVQFFELVPTVPATPAPSGFKLVLLGAAVFGLTWVYRVSRRVLRLRRKGTEPNS